METCAGEELGCKRLSLDLLVPDSVLGRRGGISFGPTTSTSKPRLGVSY